MIRRAICCAAALCAAGGLSSCASGLFADEPEGPAWLAEGVARADAANPGYLEVSQLPDRDANRPDVAESARNTAELVALRDAILNDPAYSNPDADVDPEALTRQSLARAEEEVQRAAEDD